MSLVQKPEKLSSVCVAGALRDGVCAYTALHTHARMAAGNTILVFDGASVCKNDHVFVAICSFGKFHKGIIDHAPISSSPYSLLALCVSSWLVTMEQKF